MATSCMRIVCSGTRTKEIPGLPHLFDPSSQILVPTLATLGQAEAEEHRESVIALSSTAELELEKEY